MRVFCHELVERQLLLVSGQIIECNPIGENRYQLTLGDSFGTAEFKWEQQIQLGLFVEVVCQYAPKRMHALVINKLIPNKLSSLTTNEGF